MPYVFAAIYLLILWGIFHHIEIRLRILARLKCAVGIHNRYSKALGKTVRKYHCIYCNKPKNRPNLKILQGGKKTIDTNFKF